jgi:large subunit ribosomal protein L16
MLVPTRVKYRKQHRPSLKGRAHRGNTISYGDYGLQAAEAAWITNRQIEAARIAMTRYIKRGGKVWIKIFPDRPITAKPAETRMGSGKGTPEYWVAVVKPGRVMFELAGVPEDIAKEALRLAMHKLPLKCKIIAKDGSLSTPVNAPELARIDAAAAASEADDMMTSAEAVVDTKDAKAETVAEIKSESVAETVAETVAEAKTPA